MQLIKVEIKNYRSIESILLEFSKMKDNSSTFGLIGVNEAGKSSILKAMALKDELITPSRNDFKNTSKPIEINYFYRLDKDDLNLITNPAKRIINAIQLIEQVIDKGDDSESEGDILFKTSMNTISNFEFLDIELLYKIENIEPYKPTIKVDCKSVDEKVLKDIEFVLEQFIEENIHKSIFWTSEQKYLISQPIDIVKFGENPESISIPLKNCFTLAGINNIQERVQLLGDSTEIEKLQDELGESVTEHIKNVWSTHPIKITFLISGGNIHFHIKDIGSNSKAKTADQRSDGFKQFISFLLTVSAQNKNKELSNSILLLDEPETHLHPQAQESLLKELIEITKNERKNIVLFATHSNYMIDKNDLSRNHQVQKVGDKTATKVFLDKRSSYASVNYEVYEILSNDYHNELFGAIQEREQLFKENEFDDFLVSKGFQKSISYNKQLPNGTINTYQVTLPTKIRHIIHHPENTNNAFTPEELKESIEKLILIKNQP